MKKLLLIIGLSGILGLVRAQQTDAGAAVPNACPIAGALSARVDSLETRVTGWEKFLAAMPKISGYAQVGYKWSEDASSFFIKCARVTFSGGILPDLKYGVQVEFLPVRVMDAFLNYTPYRQFNLQAGQFKVPFSITNTEYLPLQYELIEYPLALQKLVGFKDVSGIAATGRDIGLQAYGGFFKRDGYSILNYNVGIFDGEGMNVEDKNKSKDVVARLTVRPVAGLQISGSYYWGEYGAEYLERTRYGVGVCYDYGSYLLRAEYLAGTTGTQKSAGVYAVAGYRATKTLQVLAQYDMFKEDKSLRTSRQTNYTAGLLWAPKKFLRCQLNYTYEDYAGARRGGNLIEAMLTGIF